MKDLLKQLYEYRLDDSHSHDDMVDAMADCFSPDLVAPNSGKQFTPLPEDSCEGRPLYRVNRGGMDSDTQSGIRRILTAA